MTMFNKTVCGNPAQEHENKGVSENPQGPSRNIVVNEIFGPTIQGEGKSSGKEVMFLRTSGCNLACSWCDTPYTWNWTGTKFVHPDKYDKKQETHTMSVKEVSDRLHQLGPQVKALVISGGEPMLQQSRLLPLLKQLKQDNYWVEIETNGTALPSDDFISLIDQINCSPKLSNSGSDNSLKKREVPEALHKLSKSDKTCFKFVVTRREDMPEILSLVQKYNMKNVYLMPEGRTKVEQLARQDEIEQVAKEHGFSFSPRLHILQWGEKRGV